MMRFVIGTLVRRLRTQSRVEVRREEEETQRRMREEETQRRMREEETQRRMREEETQRRMREEETQRRMREEETQRRMREEETQRRMREEEEKSKWIRCRGVVLQENKEDEIRRCSETSERKTRKTIITIIITLEPKNGTQQKDTEEKEKGKEEIEEKKLGVEEEMKPGEKVKGKNKAVEEAVDKKKKNERNILRGIMQKMKIKRKTTNMEDPKVKGKNEIEEVEKTKTFTEEKNKAVEEAVDKKKKNERNILGSILEKMKIKGKTTNMEDPKEERIPCRGVVQEKKKEDQKECQRESLFRRFLKLFCCNKTSESSEIKNEEDIEPQITNKERQEIKKTVTYLGAKLIWKTLLHEITKPIQKKPKVKQTRLEAKIRRQAKTRALELSKKRLNIMTSVQFKKYKATKSKLMQQVLVHRLMNKVVTRDPSDTRFRIPVIAKEEGKEKSHIPHVKNFWEWNNNTSADEHRGSFIQTGR